VDLSNKRIHSLKGPMKSIKSNAKNLLRAIRFLARYEFSFSDDFISALKEEETKVLIIYNLF
jgi:tRNA nucleotidyltransferase/poly(A) polymerase